MIRDESSEISSSRPANLRNSSASKGLGPGYGFGMLSLRAFGPRDGVVVLSATKFPPPIPEFASKIFRSPPIHAHIHIAEISSDVLFRFLLVRIRVLIRQLDGDTHFCKCSFQVSQQPSEQYSEIDICQTVADKDDG